MKPYYTTQHADLIEYIMLCIIMIQLTWLHLAAHVLLLDTLPDAVLHSLDNRVRAMFLGESVTAMQLVTTTVIAALTSTVFSVLLVSVWLAKIRKNAFSSSTG